MKLYNLIIFNQDVWNAPTDYLGSFTTPKKQLMLKNNSSRKNVKPKKA